MEKDHKCSMVTWGGQMHYHKVKRGREEMKVFCSEMHGYCMDVLCSFVLNVGDNRALS